MADPSALGIFPPCTVAITTEDGWRQEWPWHCVTLDGEEVVVSVDLLNGRRRVIFYPYEHAHGPYQLRGHSWWRFIGSETFKVEAGPPQPACLQ